METLSLSVLVASLLTAWFIAKKEKWWDLNWFKFFAVLMIIRAGFMLGCGAGTD